MGNSPTKKTAVTGADKSGTLTNRDETIAGKTDEFSAEKTTGNVENDRDDQTDQAEDTQVKSAGPPKVGSFVTVLDEDGEPVRYGLVVGDGRSPNKDKDESPEPLVVWLPAAAAYGGELSTLA